MRADVKLTRRQDAEIDRLCTALLERVQRQEDDEPNGDWSNVFGLIGSRGAGKSTLLREFGRHLRPIVNGRPPTAPQGSNETAKARLRALDVWVLPAIDCSALPDQVEPAAAVLMRIMEDGALWERKEGVTERRREELKARLRSLAGAHVKGDASYRELCQELSTSPDDFPEYLIEGVSGRFALQQQLSECLDAIKEALGAPLLVVGLDDFDLIAGTMIRRWMQALLDTLRQPRLAFVLTADVHRLEYISLDRQNEIDEETGKALLVKLLPLRNRVPLSAFTTTEWREFKPSWAPGATTLGNLIDAYRPPSAPWLTPLVEALVPRLPRGLVQLHEVLAAQVHEPGRALLPNDGSPADQTLLLHLAGCRAEPLLARRLGELHVPDKWLEELMPREPSRAAARASELVETWAQMVEASLRQPLQPLGPLAPALKRRASLANTPGHDPTWSYPLRHDQHLVHPLRDAHDDDGRAFWTELLIDLALFEAPRNRGYLLSRWRPLHERSARACFRVRFTVDELAALFESRHFRREMLPWLSWVDSGGRAIESRATTFALDIGWSPLLLHLRHAASAWPASLLQALVVGPETLRGSLGLRRPRFDLALLPQQVRALILLVDALSNCPWEALAAPGLGWSPLTYLRVAAVLVRTAYLRALERLETEGKHPPGEPQPPLASVLAEHAPFIQALQHADPGFGQAGDDLDAAPAGNALREAHMLELLAGIRDDGLRAAFETRPHSPLAQAGLAYLDLAAYRVLTVPAQASRQARAARSWP